MVGFLASFGGKAKQIGSGGWSQRNEEGKREERGKALKHASETPDEVL